jgi:hypothetical protein
MAMVTPMMVTVVMNITSTLIRDENDDLLADSQNILIS